MILFVICLQIDLPKSSFYPPVGWEWDGDWALSKEFSEVSTTPDETVLEVGSELMTKKFCF